MVVTRMTSTIFTYLAVFLDYNIIIYAITVFSLSLTHTHTHAHSLSPLPPASFDMKIPVDGLFFIGMQLVAVSNTGKVAVWQSVQKHWQLQEVEPICSYDMAASFLLLGCTNGSIYYIGVCG